MLLRFCFCGSAGAPLAFDAKGGRDARAPTKTTLKNRFSLVLMCGFD